ncbi:MAG TPA: hypothetical protein EYP85_05125 [Armatimonadetes bacterium]|nr:hypothetical protein [Armatimonadota bacterium]
MGLAIEHGNVIVTLMMVHLLASLLAAEVRVLRGAIVALIFQSATLAAIFAAFGLLWTQPWLYGWAGVAVITKVVLIPLLLWMHVRQFPSREVRPIIGFRPSVALVVIFIVAFYRFIYTYIYFIAPTSAALVEPAKSSLAMAFTVFLLGLYMCMAKRDVVKIVIGIVVLENGIHLSLVTLAPGLPETTIMGITSNIIIAAWLLLYLAGRIYQTLGTTDTLMLSELKR